MVLRFAMPEGRYSADVERGAHFISVEELLHRMRRGISSLGSLWGLDGNQELGRGKLCLVFTPT